MLLPGTRLAGWGQWLLASRGSSEPPQARVTQCDSELKQEVAKKAKGTMSLGQLSDRQLRLPPLAPNAHALTWLTLPLSFWEFELELEV